MATDDFSFPTHMFPSSIDSPPLWRLSPAATSSSSEEEDHSHEEDITNGGGGGDHDVKYCNQRRKSLSHIELGGRKMGDEEDEDNKDHDEEEKMDMLWEGFNEELMSRTTTSDYSGMLSREMLLLGCGRAFKLSKKNNGDHHRVLATRNKPSVVTIMKVLKRLFFLHSSHHKLKTPAW